MSHVEHVSSKMLVQNLIWIGVEWRFLCNFLIHGVDSHKISDNMHAVYRSVVQIFQI